MKVNMSPLPANLPELTSVRAVAAFTVVLFHIYFSEDNPQTIFNNLIANGHLGVDFFFMLSGFILAHVYIPQWRTGSFEYSGFLVNRFARVYPLHIFMVFAVLLAYQGANFLGASGDAQGQNWVHFPFHLSLTHAWGFVDSHSWNFPSWSVSAEAFAYILFPAMLLVLLKLRWWMSLIVVAGLFLLGSMLAENVFDKGLTKLTYDFGILRIVPEFSMGIAAYLLMERYRLPENWIRPSLYLCIAITIFLAVIKADERIIVFCLLFLLVCLAHCATLSKGGAMRSRLFVYLGEISYATYMVHILVLFVAKAVAPKLGLSFDDLIVFVICIIFIYVGSVILYHCIERPGRRFLRRKLSGVRSPS